MEGMSTTQLKLLFDALDADKNGTLDREEVQKLVETVLQEALLQTAVWPLPPTQIVALL